jgi:2-amino-4-hydroxy-6-hydroxymethyldihydropteridine diphosphokinase
VAVERVAIALGSNLGQRDSHLHLAIVLLRSDLSNVLVSDLVETEPVGVGPQPPFLNGALTGDCEISPRSLLDRLLDIERAGGRSRPHPGAPRTIDLDLILFGARTIDQAGLQVPHPRFRERGFVLRPLVQIAPEMVDPVTGLTVAELYQRWKELQSCGSH